MSANPAAVHDPVKHQMEIERNAYNVAFSELGLAWYWDAATYAQLRAAAQERCHVRSYLEAHQPHLLSAYDADFLVCAIEARRSEFGAFTRMPCHVPHANPFPRAGEGAVESTA